MFRRDFFKYGLASLLTSSSFQRIALARSKYPNRPIRLIVPFPPGGGFDAVGRPWAERMKPLLGTIIVENQGGGGGSLGAASVARAAPDGYTILLGGSSTHVTESLLKKRPLYDPLKALTPISNIAFSAFAIVVNPSVPSQDLGQFISYAKANSGKVSYGSAGVGSLNHLTGELFKSLTNTLGIVHVPYRGSGPAINDALGGQVSMITPAVTAQVLELHRSGKLKILAVTSPTRLKSAPEIPTAVEAGVPGMISFQLIGLFAPNGTPQAIIDEISQASRIALSNLAYQKTMQDAGFGLDVDSTPEKLRQYINSDLERWKPLIKELGIKID